MDQDRRTEYAIKLQHIGQWAGTRRTWVDHPIDALRFPTMTRATIAAIDVLELAPDAFTVEAV